MQMKPIIATNKNIVILKERIRQAEVNRILKLENQVIDLRKTKYSSSMITNDQYAGKIMESKCCGQIKILEYFSYDKIFVMFINTGFKIITSMNAILTYMVNDPYAPTYFNAGYLGIGPYSIDNTIYDIDSFNKWKDLLSICYGPKQSAVQIMTNEWLNYQYFAAWYESELYVPEGLNARDMFINKDIISPGTIEYGPSTCIILPSHLNDQTKLTSIEKSYISKFQSGKMSVNEQNKFMQFKNFKEVQIRHLADVYSNIIPYNVFMSLKGFRII